MLILFSPGSPTLLGRVDQDLSRRDLGKAAAQAAEGTSGEGPRGWSRQRAGSMLRPGEERRWQWGGTRDQDRGSGST